MSVFFLKVVIRDIHVIDVYYICIYTYSVLYARYIYGERTWRKVPLFERFRVRGLPEQCKRLLPKG